MKVRLSEFEVELGDDWTLEGSLDSPPLVLHDRDGGELIVSATGIVGRSLTSAADIRAKLIENAIASAKQAARHPDLVAADQLDRQEKDGFTLWSLITFTRDATTLFAQLICAGSSSVVLLTFEAPNDALATAQLDRLRSSVRRLATLRA